MSPAKAAKSKDKEVHPLTPSEVKKLARAFFAKLMAEGKNPWPHKFLESKGFVRKECPKCKKNYWTANPDRDNCGDSMCVGGYTFLHPDTPPEHHVTYLEAWKEFEKSFHTTRKPHGTVQRYPCVARWRSDVDFVAAGIYCFQPFCVSGESDPPENPLIQLEFCLRFNDLDNIGITGRHYSGFNMIGIQVFNHASKNQDPQPPFDEIEEVYWKDSCIENCYRWSVETLNIKKEDLTFIEDVWQGGGNCGSCVEFFSGGLEIGNMVFTEFAVSPIGEFSPIETKVVDVGIGLERIPWLCNGSWTSYLDVFDYILPELSQKLGVPLDTPHFRKFSNYTAMLDVDENTSIEQTWHEIGEKLGVNIPDPENPKQTMLHKFQIELKQFSDLIIICDHTRSCLFAIEDGCLPSNVGGGGNIRNILRRVFQIIHRNNWYDKLGGVEGIIALFTSHIEGLKGFVPEFKNIRCLHTVIALEYKRWTEGKTKSISALKSLMTKKKNAPLAIDDWIMAMESYGLDPGEITEITGLEPPADLWLKFDEHRIRTLKLLQGPEFDVSGIPVTEELFNLPEYERTYDYESKVIHVFPGKKAFVCEKTILYPTGGGQQHDDGYITIKGTKYTIQEIEKVTNVVIFIVDIDVDPSIVGESAHQVVDKEVREILRVQHTATHVIAAAARKVLGPHVWQNGAKKTKHGAHIDLTHYELPPYESLLEIDRVANEMILSAAQVTKKVYTRKEAEGKWGFVLYQGGAIPGNAIRVVDIAGFDTEACCGTHCDSLAEIGSVKITQANKQSDGVFRIEFVAGILAVQSHHEDMTLLRNLQGIFSVDKANLEKNCQRFFNERNGFEAANKKLALEMLTLQVDLATVKNAPRAIIRRSEDNAAIFMNGLDLQLKERPQWAGRSLVVVGQKFFYGLFTKEVIDEIKQLLDPLHKTKEITSYYEEKKPKPHPQGLVAFGSLNVAKESIPKVVEILKKAQFQD